MIEGQEVSFRLCLRWGGAKNRCKKAVGMRGSTNFCMYDGVDKSIKDFLSKKGAGI